MSAASGFLGGLAGGMEAGMRFKERKERKAADEEDRKIRREIAKRGDWYSDPSSHTGGPAPAAAAPAGDYGSTADTTLPIEARAFLDGTSSGESGGKYNVRYSPTGGVEFDPAKGHPRIYEDGPAGRSSAAGRYQFTAQTWDEYGGADFGDKAQDQAAWKLATDRYRATAGGDLLADLRKGGMSAGIMDALTPTWAAFGDPKKRAGSVSTYASSLARYGTPPAAAESPAPARREIASPRWGWASEIMTKIGGA